MLTALVLICSVAVTPDLRDCERENAVAVMRLPVATGNPATCFMLGQAFLAVGRARLAVGWFALERLTPIEATA